MHNFSMRSMASGGAFHVAYYHATQQAFLEAHELAFRHFGGVFRLLRYDNLKSAVKKILRGHQRVETERLIAFRSHWGFQTDFCNPARGNEKGGVEGEVGYFRRNHLVPIPCVQDLAELNEHLLRGCREDEQRRITGKSLSVGEAMRIEREHLLPLAAEGFELAGTSFPTVDGKGCVKVRTNWYSTPLKPATHCQARLLPAYVEIWHERQCVARHERSFARYQQVLDLEHYLDVLERKPGALAGSTPLQQWRERGRWPASFDRLWQSLAERQGRAAGVDGGIVLLQAALELLSWQSSVRVRKGLSRNKFNELSAEDKLRFLIESCGIPTGIPPGLSDLVSKAKELNCSDGPKALTVVRNRLVHPKKRKHLPHYDAWRLAEWYVELALLSMLRFSGEYSDRTKAQRWVGAVDRVPWAKP